MSSTLSTLIWETVNFLVIVALLHRLLYKPVRRFIRQRRERMEAERQAVAQARKEAESIRRQYEEKLRALEEEQKSTLAAARARADEEAKEILEKARRQARALREAADRHVAVQVEEGAAALRGEVKKAALELVRRVASFAGAGALHDAALAEVERLLAELPEENRRRTARLLAEGDGTVRVAAAPELDEDHRRRLADLLRKCIPLDGEIRLEVEHRPDLIAGIELRLENLLVRAHWRDRLERFAAAEEAGLAGESPAETAEAGEKGAPAADEKEREDREEKDEKDEREKETE